MRRFFTSLAALSLLGAAVGCNHTAGQCDCDCEGSCGGGSAQLLRPSPLQKMPKLNGDAEKPAEKPAEKVDPADAPKETDK